MGASRSTAAGAAPRLGPTSSRWPISPALRDRSHDAPDSIAPTQIPGAGRRVDRAGAAARLFVIPLDELIVRAVETLLHI